MNNTTFSRQTSSAPTFSSMTTHSIIQSFGKNYKMLFLWLIVINAVMAFVAIFLNLLIIVTYIKTSSLREKASYVLILGLAISDLFVGTTSQPLSCIYYISLLKRYIGLQESVQIAYFTCSFFLSLVSFLNFTAIIVDRFLALYLHLRYQDFVTSKRCGVALAGIWIFSFLLCSTLFRVKSFKVIVVPILFIVIIVNAILFFKISRVIRRHSMQIHAQQQLVQQSIDMPKYKKSVNTMYYVASAFVFCYTPFLAMMFIVVIFEPGSPSISLVFLPIFNCLAKTISVIHPVIFCWRMKEMRSAVKNIIRGTLSTTRSRC